MLRKSRTVSPVLAVAIMILPAVMSIPGCVERTAEHPEQRVAIESDGWEIVGDLMRPASPEPVAAVLTLNQAAGDRSDYAALARALADRGVATLRIDLRAHGESTNLGVFTPDVPGATSILEGSERDVQAAVQFLRAQSGIDPSRIGIVGASYSGEAMAEAGRAGGYARAYVALSPGSFSTESAQAVDGSGAAWLFIRSRNERVDWVRIAVDSVQAYSRTAEVWILPGTEHATRILPVHRGLPDRIADWLQSHLSASQGSR